MYSPGILKDRVTFIVPGTMTDGDYGRTAGTPTEVTRWAKVDFSRGVKSLREGALDSYDVIMVRLCYDASITRECKLRYDGVTYQIQSFHADKQAKTIQLTATEQNAV